MIMASILEDFCKKYHVDATTVATFDDEQNGITREHFLKVYFVDGEIRRYKVTIGPDGNQYQDTLWRQDPAQKGVPLVSYHNWEQDPMTQLISCNYCKVLMGYKNQAATCAKRVADMVEAVRAERNRVQQQEEAQRQFEIFMRKEKSRQMYEKLKADYHLTNEQVKYLVEKVQQYDREGMNYEYIAAPVEPSVVLSNLMDMDQTTRSIAVQDIKAIIPHYNRIGKFDVSKSADISNAIASQAKDLGVAMSKIKDEEIMKMFGFEDKST